MNMGASSSGGIKMNNPRISRRIPGFGEGVAQTFAPTANEVLMTTLKDMLAQPEMDLSMAAKKQEMGQSAQRFPLEQQYKTAQVADVQAQARLRDAQAKMRPLAELQKEDDATFKMASQMAMKNVFSGMIPGEQLGLNTADIYTVLRAAKSGKPVKKPVAGAARPGAAAAPASDPNINPKTGQPWAEGDISPTGSHMVKGGKWVPKA